MSRRIERTRKGELRLRLPAAERDALRSVPDQLRTLLTQQPEDPSLYRLFPAAYGDDPELEEVRDSAACCSHMFVSGKPTAFFRC